MSSYPGTRLELAFKARKSDFLTWLEEIRQLAICEPLTDQLVKFLTRWVAPNLWSTGSYARRLFARKHAQERIFLRAPLSHHVMNGKREVNNAHHQGKWNLPPMPPTVTINGHAGRKDDCKELEDEHACQPADACQPQNEPIHFPIVQKCSVLPGKISVIRSGQKDAS